MFVIKIAFFWLAVLITLVPLPLWAAHTAMDAENRQIKLHQPAKRIISLAPHITELLFSAGAGDKVVATVEYSDYPPAANNIPRIGSYNRFDLELMLSHQPDLVVAWSSGNAKQSLAKLQKYRIPVFYSEPHNIDDILLEIEQLAKLTGTEKFANQQLQQYRKTYQTLQNTYQTDKKLSVFYQVWDQPLMTVNGEHLISQVLDLCGGKNIFFDTSTFVPQIDKEAVIVRNPQMILTSTKPGQDETWKAPWLNWEHIDAVKHQQLFAIPADLISRHTPRILQGAEIICQHVHRARAVYQ